MDTCHKCGYFRPPNHSTTKDAAGKVIRFLCSSCNYAEEHEARFVEASKFGHNQLAESLIAEVKRRNLKDVKCKGEYEDRFGLSRKSFATGVVVKPLKTKPWKKEIEIYLLLSRDEIIAEMPLGVGSVQEVETLMGAAISWADGLPLKGNGFETTYYRKD